MRERHCWSAAPLRAALLDAAVLVGLGVGSLGCGAASSDPSRDGGLVPDGQMAPDGTGLPDGGSGTDAGGPVTVEALTVTENSRNPLSVYVTWRTDVPVPTSLHVSCGEAVDTTLTAAAAVRDHEVFVMGLVSGERCTYTAHPVRSAVLGQRSETVPVSPVPAALPAVSVDVVDAARMAPGWTLFSVADAGAASTDAHVVAIDAQGRYRWYYAAGVDYPQPEAEVMPVAEGLLLGNLRRFSRIVTWEGETLWELGVRSHHDLVVDPEDPASVLFPSSRQTPCPAGGGVEHSVLALDRGSGAVTWDWWLCDHWTPRLPYAGWSHINAVVPVAGERAVLVSSRNQDLILKVDRDTDAVLWTLGRDGDFAMDPADVFLRQHAPEIQPGGTILLFDNGLKEDEAANEGLEARTYSRVLEFALHFDAAGQPQRAEVIWDYTDPTVFATSRSEADRLTNGNTLIHYCYVLPDRRLILREVSPDGQVLWNVTTPPDVASYRSERFGPFYGYVKQ